MAAGLGCSHQSPGRVSTKGRLQRPFSLGDTMFKQRVITALVLLALLLPAVAAQDVRFFLALSVLLIGAAAWEWARLNARSQVAALGSALVCVALAAWAYALGWSGPQAPAWLWPLGALIWVLAGALALRAGPQRWGQMPVALRWPLGLLLLVLAWLALQWSHREGGNFLLSVLSLVWGADVGAYAAGRLWGGRVFRAKLAPTISPGKTWEGVLGGFAVVLALACSWLAWDAAHPEMSASLHTRLWQQGPWVAGAAWVFLTAMSVAGDLLESLIKRSAGVKDSSRLLPGHGGVLDRVDALLPVLPLAVMLCAQAGPWA